MEPGDFNNDGKVDISDLSIPGRQLGHGVSMSPAASTQTETP